MINDHEKMNAGLVGTVSDRGGMINYQGGMTPDHEGMVSHRGGTISGQGGMAPDHGGTVSCHMGIIILQPGTNNLRLAVIFLENSILFNQKMWKSAAI